MCAEKTHRGPDLQEGGRSGSDALITREQLTIDYWDAQHGIYIIHGYSISEGMCTKHKAITKPSTCLGQ